MNAPLLEVTGLRAWYHQARILNGVEIEIAAGEVVALLGRNGAGKSTLLKALIGLLPGRSGQARFAGHNLLTLPAHRIARLGIGYVPEERRIFSDLTVLENLAVGRAAPRPQAPVWSPERLFELFPNLAELRHRRGGLISGGEQQMLAIARTLMGNPCLLLLDEPSEGLAPLIVERLIETIAALKRQGLTILLSEPNLGFAGAVSDRLYLLEQGRISFTGTIADLKAQPAVASAALAV